MGQEDDMDEAEGFFPERKLLAYRRSLLTAEPVPGRAARDYSFPWWVLLVCLGPSYVSVLWGSMDRGHRPGQILVLVLASVALTTCVLFAVAAVLWTYRRPRTLTVFTPE